MKTNIILAFLLLFFCSCSDERRTDGGDYALFTRGYIDLEVTDEHSDEDGADPSDDIKSIRFIVMTDLDSRPTAEVNEFREVTDADRASALKAVLEVSRTESGMNNKLVVAIANEPAGMKERLDNVSTMRDLEEIELEMGSFVSADHLSLLADAAMPMSGAVWTTTDNVYRTEEEAEINRVAMKLERAVARVDVWLTTDHADGLQITSGSTVTLGNTYGQSYFVHHESGGKAVGMIQTVEEGDMTSKAWTQSDATLNIPCKTPAVPGTPTSVHVCTFYTPERSSIADKLRLDVGVNVSGDDGLKSGSLELTEADDEHGTSHDIDVVRRNTTYKVTVTIGTNGITGVVQDWESVEVVTEL